MNTGGAGHLLIYLVRDPESFSNDLILVGDDKSTGNGIFGNEWGELFYDILKCPHPPQFQGDMSTYQERRSEEFRKALPRNPMLARIFDMFADAWYRPEEIAALRAECVQVRDEGVAAETPEALQKLLVACDEALKMGTGLYLACD